LEKKRKHFPPKKIQNFFIADKIIEEKKIATNHNFVVNVSNFLKIFEKV
jgi:hypothetical protein